MMNYKSSKVKLNLEETSKREEFEEVSEGDIVLIDDEDGFRDNDPNVLVQTDFDKFQIIGLNAFNRWTEDYYERGITVEELKKKFRLNCATSCKIVAVYNGVNRKVKVVN